MKNKPLHNVFLLLFLLTAVGSFAQTKKYFAVTGDQYGSVNWIVFREFQPGSKVPVRTLYIPAESNEAVYDAASGEKLLNASAGVSVPPSLPQACGCINTRMVAAIAYDVKNNYLYYTQMMGNQLRYLDLNSAQPKSYAVTMQLLKSFSNQPGEASVITRMVIASDKYGYALTNDNQHLIRFSTGKRTAITDLGKLADAKSNGENSINTQFKSWGGDMVADAGGSLYLFTMQHMVFKINPNTRLATYLGQIKNIPDDYTINAAMVDGDNVVVGSSTKTTGYYRVNLSTFDAEAILGEDQVYNVSDFANESLAFNKAANVSSGVAKTFNENIVKVYPNPSMGGKLNIQFGNFSLGKYVVQISDLQGKALLQKELKITGSQIENITVNSIASGTYILRVIDVKGKDVYNNNVIISK